MNCQLYNLHIVYPSDGTLQRTPRYAKYSKMLQQGTRHTEKKSSKAKQKTQSARGCGVAFQVKNEKRKAKEHLRTTARQETSRPRNTGKKQNQGQTTKYIYIYTRPFHPPIRPPLPKGPLLLKTKHNASWACLPPLSHDKTKE